MSIFKRGKFYWYKFMWDGKLVRESTRQKNDTVARNIEAAHRSQLAQGLVGIREKKPAPTLTDFLKKDFLPYAETRHINKPRSLRYYKQGCDMLYKSDLGARKLDEITDQHAQAFSAKFSSLSPSGINRGLRTLRRALNLAFQWGKLEKPVKIALAPGEHQRDRVLTPKESEKYLAACPQPWRDIATIILDEGFRPGEVFPLQWSHIVLDQKGGLIQIADGKSKAARRVLPMTPRVFHLLRGRHEEADKPTEGYVFPSGAAEGHFNGDSAKGQHKKALTDSGVEPFEPYVLRHTALTRIADACKDPFVVMKIAGHSSITMTQRYCHPQSDAIERAFTELARKPSLGTKLGTTKKRRSARLVAAK